MSTSVYQYMTTDLVTGAVTGDWLPLTVQSFSRALNGSGTFTGALNLTAGTSGELRSWLTALETRRNVLWALLDGVPVWNGIVWDWQHQSILDGTLPIAASTMDSLFGKRLIETDLEYDNADVFDVFRALAVYATSKGPGYGVAGLNLGTVESGFIDTISYSGADEKQVASAWSDLVATYDFEYAFRAGLDTSGNLTTFLDLAMPELGLQFPASSLVYRVPGNLIDYAWTRTGSSSFNRVLGTASASDSSGTTWVSAYPHGYDLGDIAAGYPVTEESVALTTFDVTAQDQIDTFADGVLPAVSRTQLTPLLTLGNEQGPSVKDIVLGSWCQLALTSPLHPAMPDGSPGYQGLARIIGWTVNPPSQQQAETTQIQTWVPVL